MKNFMILLFALISAPAFTQQGNIHQFSVNTLEGDVYKLSSLQGKKVMIVNVASKCGLTPQYEELQSLYEQFKDSNFIIIGFPANNFLNQEPGTPEEIRSFCTKNYGVTFPIMEKISVKGNDIHPLYAWLTSKAQNGVEDAPVQWNFQKFLIDENGNYVRSVSPKTSPLSEDIVNWIRN